MGHPKLVSFNAERRELRNRDLQLFLDSLQGLLLLSFTKARKLVHEVGPGRILRSVSVALAGTANDLRDNVRRHNLRESISNHTKFRVLRELFEVSLLEKPRVTPVLLFRSRKNVARPLLYDLTNDARRFGLRPFELQFVAPRLAGHLELHRDADLAIATRVEAAQVRQVPASFQCLREAAAVRRNVTQEPNASRKFVLPLAFGPTTNIRFRSATSTLRKFLQFERRT